MKRIARSSELTKLRPDIAKRLNIELPVEKTISPNEAAELLGITGEAVKQWVYHGKLPAVKLHNGYWRIKVSDLSNFITKRMCAPKHRILITETDRATQEFLRRTIRESQHEEIIGNSNLDTMLKVRKERPSVVIVDLTHSNGWSLIRSIERETARKLLIIAAGNETPEQTNIILQSEASAVLNKPLEAVSLKRELLRLTGQDM